MFRRLKFRTSAALGLAAAVLLVAPALADGLFASPNLGMSQPSLPRVAPLPKSSAVPQFNANQCQLAAGTCPTGRLRRSGNICFCDSGNGTVRQGTTRVKPQDARPSINPSDSSQ